MFFLVGLTTENIFDEIVYAREFPSKADDSYLWATFQYAPNYGLETVLFFCGEERKVSLELIFLLMEYFNHKVTFWSEGVNLF